MYRIAHLACILAAAALCSGAAVEPRGDIRHDQPGSNLKEASISHPSASARNGGVTKVRRDYDRRDYRLLGRAGGDPHRQEPPHSTKHRRQFRGGNRDHSGPVGGSAPEIIFPH